MYVNLLGFSLEKTSENFVSPEKFKEITDWLSGLEYVAEFNFSHPESMLAQLQDYPGIQYIEPTEEIHLGMLANTNYGLILRKQVNHLDALEELISKSATYKENEITLLLVSDTLELDQNTISKIKSLAKQCQILLGFGLEASSVEKTAEVTGVKGIALQGGEEIKPGLKDFDELADILEVLEEED
jgi:phosphoribosylanthranilate isomerase